MTTGNGQATVTRADIEAKLREIQGITDSTGEAAQNAAKPALAVVGVGVVLAAFLLGRRRGQKRSTIIEVRRA